MEFFWYFVILSAIWLSYRLFFYFRGQYNLKNVPLKKETEAFAIAKKIHGDYYTVKYAGLSTHYHCYMPMYKFSIYYKDEFRKDLNDKLAHNFYVCTRKDCPFSANSK